MSTKVRVRFAPSPTGPLHIGGVRTALYNYLFAKNKGGKMILRIEDTDQTRFVEGAEEYLIDALKWCGIKLDESVVDGGKYGPYRQSERKESYFPFAQKLVKKGYAYYAFDTAEELSEMRERLKNAGVPSPQYNAITRNSMQNSLSLSETEVASRMNSGRPYVIRIKIPRNEEIKLKDKIRGWVVVNTNNMDDKVIFKSDGMPTYHLANVVDDSKMEISHVLRGEEWISSTPKHLLIYDFINAKVPEFIHLPLIFGKDKSKLSKRHGANSIIEYKKQGLLPNALLNYLALLGWSPGNDLEFLTPEDISKLFEIKGLSTSPSIFDAEKLSWINGVHIREMNDEKLANIIKEEVEANSMEDIKYIDEDYLKISSLIKERIKSINDIYPLIKFFFDYELPKKDLIKCADLDNNEIESLIKKLVNDLSLLNENNKYDTQSIEELLRKNCKELNLKVRDYLSLIRNCITGSEVSPPLFESIEILGIKETNIRLNNCLNLIS